MAKLVVSPHNTAILSLQIWVSSPHNGSGYYGLGDSNDQLLADHFQSTITSDPSNARTGSSASSRNLTRRLLMDVRKCTTLLGGIMLCVCFVAYFDSLYVVGSRDEAMNIRRLCYQPVNIKSTVVCSHKNVVER